MPLLRRDVAADPAVVARLGALFPVPARPSGWVPPPEDAAVDPVQVDAAVDPVQVDTAVDARQVDAAVEVRLVDVSPPAGVRDVEVDLPAVARPPAGASPWARWRSARIDPGRRGVAALALVAVLAAALAGLVVLRSRPHALTVPTVVASGVPVPGSAALASPSATAGGEVVVAVGGAVPRPGLVHLPAGSRVDDAVRAAGGVLPGADLGVLNLARRLVDGEQVLVGVPPPAGAADPAPSGGTGSAAGPVDLNAASAAELDALPGIGPVLAQKIVDWRTEHGRFGSVDQLREVSGIGESKYGELKDKVRV